MGNLTPALPGFEPGARRKPKRLRSEQAKERHRQRERERYRQHGRPPRTCPACGEQYRPTCGDQKACSRKCAFALHSPKPKSSPIYIRDCICGKTFIARSSKARSCSEPCALAQARLRAREYARTKRGCIPEGTVIAVICIRCSEPFDWVVTRGGSKKLCDPCRAEAEQQWKKQNKKNRKARQRGVHRIERYTLAEIAKRDRYYCQLCSPKRRVAMTKAVPHPKAPTIDHIIPLVEGGDDTKANVQLAHFLCNSLKSAGGSQQLRMIG